MIQLNSLLLEQLELHKKNSAREIVLNCILVFHGGREAFLLETSNHLRDYGVPEAWQYTRELASKLNLFFTSTDDGVGSFPRALVTKHPLNSSTFTETDLALLLGFYCAGHQFSNQNITRISFSIHELSTNTSLMAEVCEFSKTQKDEMERKYTERVSSWNAIISSYLPDCRVVMKVSISNPMKLRLNAAIRENISYIMENREEYAEDLENNFAECSAFHVALMKNDRNFIEKNFVVFRMIYLGFYRMRWLEEAYRADVVGMEKRFCALERDLFKLIETHGLN